MHLGKMVLMREPPLLETSSFPGTHIEKTEPASGKHIGTKQGKSNLVLLISVKLSHCLTVCLILIFLLVSLHLICC